MFMNNAPSSQKRIKGLLSLDIIIKVLLLFFVALVFIVLIKHFDVDVTSRVTSVFDKMTGIVQKFGVIFE